MRSVLHSNRSERLSRVPQAGGGRTTSGRQALSANTRRELPLLSGQGPSDETLIVDARAGLGPAQLVERKLICLLKSVYMPVSHVRTATLCNGRNHPSTAAD
jgi:hypothetical protein